MEENQKTPNLIYKSASSHKNSLPARTASEKFSNQLFVNMNNIVGFPVDRAIA